MISYQGAYSNIVWTTIVEAVLSKHESFRNILSMTSVEKCDLCQEAGGIMLSCLSSKCAKKVHLECAYRRRSLFVSEDCNLSLECSAHFKPTFFCSCKSKYDAAKNMLSCDWCCEWFHYNCLGMKESKHSLNKEFACPTCKKTLARGEVPSPITKEKNLAKEMRSAAEKNAEAIFEPIIYFIDTVCPIMDQINMQVINRDSKKSNVSEDELNKILTLIAEPPYTCPSRNGEDDDVEDIIALHLMGGIIDTCNSWGTHVSTWNKKVEEFCSLIKNYLTTLVDKNSFEHLFQNEHLNTFKIMQNSLSNLLQECGTLPVEPTQYSKNSLKVIFSVLSWICEFYNVRLHTLSFT